MQELYMWRKLDVFFMRINFLIKPGSMKTSRTYGFPHIQKAFQNETDSRGVNLSLICAIGVDGPIAYEYKTGEIFGYACGFYAR